MRKTRPGSYSLPSREPLSLKSFGGFTCRGVACAPGQKLGAALFWSLILKARKAVALEAESHAGYYEGAKNAARLLRSYHLLRAPVINLGSCVVVSNVWCQHGRTKMRTNRPA